MFKIEIDVPRKMLTIQLGGYWTLEELERFDAARRVALQRSGWASGDYVCLVDLRGHEVQSQEVVARAQACFTAEDIVPRRLATVIPRMLAKMQVSRVLKNQKEWYFNDVEEATAWLLSPWDADDALTPPAPAKAAS